MAVRVSTRRGRGHRSSMASGLIVALALLVSAVIVARSMRVPQLPKKETVVVAEFDTVSLPVPSQPVVAGTKVKDVKFQYVSFPRHQVPEGAIRDLRVVQDSIAVSPLPAKLPVFDVNFSSTYATSNPVIEKIPNGMRAMTVRVDATAAVEGWAGTGALVDVLLVTKDRSSVVAEKVRILSAERSTTPVEGNAPTVPSTVTLLVTQEQCLAINTAIPLGKIAFALRSASDEDSWSDPQFTAERLKGGRSTKVEKASVSAVVAIKGESNHYALADGKWVKTQSVPEGFLVPER